MTTAIAEPVLEKEKRFDWPLCYAAETFVQEFLNVFNARNAFSQKVAQRMRDESGTLFIDWVDHLVVDEATADRAREVGYVDDEGVGTLWHPEAMLPRLVRGTPDGVALRVDDVADFLAAHGVPATIAGDPLTRFRCATVSRENATALSVVERRGYRGYETAGADAKTFLTARELWQTRQRVFDEDARGFQSALETLDRVIDLVGPNVACHIVFNVEREFWQRRNRAAQAQKTRQDSLGLGWANHDHHTFRSSRERFVDLMRALEKLGFERRERYYTGAQAGWGAQILEQPVEGVVAFCDVDLRPEETEVDFSRTTLPASDTLGTIGLWVGLHGESFLDAGMHHLECRFDHALLREQLASLGVVTMNPFSDFPFLKQAFTEGERWPVNPQRLDRLTDDGMIDQAKAQEFREHGAIGSHLENLQRRGGFKGFNQKAVSVIIKATDPRLQDG